jgi:hypothetical protein
VNDLTETHEQMVARRTAELGVTVAEVEHLYAVVFRDLHMCGCGNPEAAVKLVHDLLVLHDLKRLDVERVAALVGTGGAVHLVFGQLDDAGLTEHGSSYWGGWLTQKGRWVLDVISRLGGADISEVAQELCLGLPHYGSDCTDACWVLGGSGG